MRIKNNGSILIFSLWVVSLLTVFAVVLGLRVRQRAAVLSRLEQRSQLRYLAQAGVKKAIAALKQDIGRNTYAYTERSKPYRHNNPDFFSHIEMAGGSVAVSYYGYDEVVAGKVYPQVRYGLVDEERKLNLNTVSSQALARLFEMVGLTPREAEDLVYAVIDWRDPRRVEVTGFYSSSYYQALEHPYVPKDAPFETIDELRLLKGMTPALFERLVPFVTVYGDGRVNINTASYFVLVALGLDEPLVEKVLYARRGTDGIEGTADDHIFQKIFDVASEVSFYRPLDKAEMIALEQVTSADMLKAQSFFYTATSHAVIGVEPRSVTAECVYNAKENRIEYWREK